MKKEDIIIDYQFKSYGNDNLVMYIDEEKNAYISYNANPGKIGALPVSFFAGDNGSDETALVMDDKFYILNGDFRSEYSEAAKKSGVAGCVQVFIDNEEECGSSWTSSSDIKKFLEERMKNDVR